MVSVREPSVAVREPPPPPRRTRRRAAWWWVPGAITVVTIASVIVVTLTQLHPSLLLTNTTTTGGDTGAHIAMPKYMETLISHGHLTGWDPGWYDGFPLYTFYFTLPDFFIAVGGWVIPYDVAFKIGTILGSVLLPVTAWACGRFFRLRPPIPTLLAAATLPFLFDYTFTIYGGNLFSTLAGEYAFSFSLALSVLFLGLFAAAVREGRHRAWAAVVLAGCLLSHIVPGLYALGGAVLLTVIELLPARWGIADTGLRLWRGDRSAEQVPRTRTLWRAGSTVGIGLLLSAFWLVPFGLERAYATSMGYTNLTTYLNQLFPEADTWALVIAGVGVVLAVLLRSRFGLTVTALGAAFALAEVFDPQGSLYNVRLLPMWFVSVYLMAGWTFGVGCILVARAWRRARQQRWDRYEASFREPGWVAAPGLPMEGAGSGGGSGGGSAESAPYATYVPPAPRRPRWGPAAVSGAIVGLVAVLLVVVPPFVSSSSWGPVHLGPNEVTNWSSYNYKGYEGQSSYAEYRGVIQSMETVSQRYGCGRAMWEYSASENRFGTPEALMLLPYWTSGCVDSMEGLLFESSTTTPYHFINQAELSQGPSEPEVGLPYGPVDVTLGVQHLQLLGVKYFMAETPEVEQQANADPALQLVAKTGPWTYNYSGVLTHTTWDIYLVKDSGLVTPLHNDPAVLSGVDPAPSGWLNQSLAWYDHPIRWNVELAQGGPASWPRTTVGDTRPPVKRVATTKVTDVAQTDTSVSFHVSKVGTPVLVKVSYFPNWHASGADGPWRVTPNLMVVVPTSHDVTLTYGRSGADYLGDFLTVVGVLALVALLLVPWLLVRRGRRARPPAA
ncbi:MAG TPA: hypothetical protein VG346_06500 [Acidimicrobiales bacterium]|nr:hypothetical protein [Acidimicrobiales bacterium]